MNVLPKTPIIGVRQILIAAGIAAMAGLSLGGVDAQPRPPGFPAVPAAQILQWHPGVTAVELNRARVVRIPHGFHMADLAALRDDQMVETPSGRRVSVSRIRFIQNAVSQAKARRRVPEGFHFLPPPTKPCTPPNPGETFAQILTRPDSDVFCMGKNNSSVSVAQLRLMQPYLERTRGVTLSDAVLVRPALAGPATGIENNQQLATLLQAQLKNAPDSTVLVNPKGERVTLGSVRAAVKARPELLVRPIPSNDRRR